MRWKEMVCEEIRNWMTNVNKHITVQDNVNTMWLSHKICASITSCLTKITIMYHMMVFFRFSVPYAVCICNVS